MSLLEMVETAESSKSFLDGANASAAGIEPEHLKKMTVSDLRDAVQKYVSLDELAELLFNDRKKAEAELRGACDQVFLNNKEFACSAEDQTRLKTSLLDVVFGMGPIEEYIDDDSVTEIMINGADEIYIERKGVIEKTDKRFANDEQVRVLLDKVLAPLGRRIDESSPMVNARLERGHRVNAIIPPLSPDGPIVTIRAFSKNLLTLEEMLLHGSVDLAVYEFIRWVVQLRKNIVVSGGTGSGKTTMLNAASCFIPRGERVITIEDSLELKFSPDLHVVRLEARPMNSEGAGEVTIRDLVKNALRMRPNRIIVGECRGGEALDMLQAMNTGHDGSMTTIHANSCEDVVERMTALVRYAVELPLDAIISQLGSAFDFIFQVKRGRTGERFLSEISKVDFDREERRVRVTPIYKRGEFNEAGVWHVDAEIPEQVLAAEIANPKEVEEWLRITAS